MLVQYLHFDDFVDELVVELEQRVDIDGGIVETAVFLDEFLDFLPVQSSDGVLLLEVVVDFDQIFEYGFGFLQQLEPIEVDLLEFHAQQLLQTFQFELTIVKLLGEFENCEESIIVEIVIDVVLEFLLQLLYLQEPHYFHQVYDLLVPVELYLRAHQALHHFVELRLLP